LERVCSDEGLTPIDDPSNSDARFERVRIRRALENADWLDPLGVARSAANLGDADTALDWAARNEWKSAVQEKHGLIVYRKGDAPVEIVRRIVGRAIRHLATEGEGELRGRELDQVLSAMRNGEIATLRGVRCEAGREWRFTTAPARRS
jgi:tRNA(Ile)-lysidine synthase